MHFIVGSNPTAPFFKFNSFEALFFDVFLCSIVPILEFFILCFFWSFYWYRGFLLFIYGSNFYFILHFHFSCVWDRNFRFNVHRLLFSLNFYWNSRRKLRLPIWSNFIRDVISRFRYIIASSSLFNRVYARRSASRTIYVLFITIHGFYAYFSYRWQFCSNVFWVRRNWLSFFFTN